jgi:flagellar basal-body rod protein FlgG
MGLSQRRLEVVSSNIANTSTPGYKRQVSFSELIEGAGGMNLSVRSDLAQGKMSATGNPLDLAISGGGFFQLRAGEELLYSRHGQFRRAEDGTVVTPQGHRLQQVGGGDLVLDRAEVEIRADGTVLDAGQVVGRIAVLAPAEASAAEPIGGSLFLVAGDAVEEVPAAELRQGMVEASNVSMGEEMVAMMAALRHAESGARLIQVYDELIGRAITTFGQGGK